MVRWTMPSRWTEAAWIWSWHRRWNYVNNLQLPDEVMMRVVPHLEMIKAENFDSKLPWNRHKRRRLRRAKALHLFSGQIKPTGIDMRLIDHWSALQRHNLLHSGESSWPKRVSLPTGWWTWNLEVLRADDHPYCLPTLPPADAELVLGDAALMFRFWSLLILWRRKFVMRQHLQRSSSWNNQKIQHDTEAQRMLNNIDIFPSFAPENGRSLQLPTTWRSTTSISIQWDTHKENRPAWQSTRQKCSSQTAWEGLPTVNSGLTLWSFSNLVSVGPRPERTSLCGCEPADSVAWSQTWRTTATSNQDPEFSSSRGTEIGLSSWSHSITPRLPALCVCSSTRPCTSTHPTSKSITLSVDLRGKLSPGINMYQSGAETVQVRPGRGVHFSSDKGWKTLGWYRWCWTSRSSTTRPWGCPGGGWSDRWRGRWSYARSTTWRARRSRMWWRRRWRPSSWGVCQWQFDSVAPLVEESKDVMVKSRRVSPLRKRWKAGHYNMCSLPLPGSTAGCVNLDDACTVIELETSWLCLCGDGHNIETPSSPRQVATTIRPMDVVKQNWVWSNHQFVQFFLQVATAWTGGPWFQSTWVNDDYGHSFAVLALLPSWWLVALWHKGLRFVQIVASQLWAVERHPRTGAGAWTWCL